MGATVKPMRVIWSAMHTGKLDPDYFLRVVDRAAGEGVAGVELSGHGVDRYIAYRAFPEVANAVNTAVLHQKQQHLRRMSECASKRGLRMGLWHHEITGPAGRNLLEFLPELRAADGLIDLESPLLYRFITEKAAEFFDLFPCVNELVLTLTETAYPVTHRPFCAVPPAERVRRVLEALVAATEPRGKQLVIRPFSALRSDEQAVREAVQSLKASNISMMYKTEPADWHAFLPDEPLIGSIDRYEIRAESDAGAEYYGQAVFPCCYTNHLQHRFEAARERGASVAVIRVDRGSHHPSLDHPINEANIVVPTHSLMEPQIPVETHWQNWLERRHGVRDAFVRDLFEQTFEVVKRALYIDGHSFSHHLIPDLAHLKHIQVFSLFEPDVPLDHLALCWAVLSEKRSPGHQKILAEKQEAMDLALRIADEFRRYSAPGMSAGSRAAIQESLDRLPLEAEAALDLCRLISAHTREMWRLPEPLPRVGAFEQEAATVLQLADRVEADYGPLFYPMVRLSDKTRTMAEELRDVAGGLRQERERQIPLRRRIERQAGLVDYVLCGFAAEGHRLAKRLHSGATFPYDDRFVRATGQGEAEGITYHLRGRQGTPQRLRVTFVDDDTGRPGIVCLGGTRYAFGLPAFQGMRTCEWDVPEQDGEEIAVAVWSTTARPCWVATLELFGKPGD